MNDIDEFKKPVVKGPVDGNIFALTGIARKALKRSGMKDKVSVMTERVFNADSYDVALSVIMEYVEFNL